MVNKPICTINDFGTKQWRLNDVLHREDGPAVEYPNGTKCWLIHGKLHRLEGPAVIYSYEPSDWWVNGVRISNEIRHWATQNNIDLDNLTEDDKLIIKFVWSSYTT